MNAFDLGRPEAGDGREAELLRQQAEDFCRWQQDACEAAAVSVGMTSAQFQEWYMNNEGTS